MENIIIPNKKILQDKISQINEDGLEKLHVLSDFDRTLTYGKNNGKKSPSLLAILREKDYLGEDYQERAKALYEQYHPIEVDASISKKEKKSKMRKWWEAHLALLVEKGLKKEHLLEIARNKTIVLRKGVEETLQKLSQKQVPVVVFSASGCGEAVEYYFEERNLTYDNIFFLVNRFYWSNENVAMGAKSPVIHSYNKDETLIKDEKNIYEEVSSKKNIILLGDSIGDAGMAEGFDYKTLIKIGFLNTDYNSKKDVDEYSKYYDVIVLGDEDFTGVNSVVFDKILK